MTTAATRLYDAQMDEQLISQVTGHRSVAVCSYTCTCTGGAQKLMISGRMQGLGNAVINSEEPRDDHVVWLPFKINVENILFCQCTQFLCLRA